MPRYGCSARAIVSMCRITGATVALFYSTLCNENQIGIIEVPGCSKSCNRICTEPRVQCTSNRRHDSVFNGHLEDGDCLYIPPPSGLDIVLLSSHVFKLNKAICGLKCASKIWNKKFHDAMKKLEFTCFRSDECAYDSIQDSLRIFVLIYADDILIMCKNDKTMSLVKKNLMILFRMHDLRIVNKFLGVEFRRVESGMFLTQEVHT